jgi:imidazolonepropionase-like amidohydrolase
MTPLFRTILKMIAGLALVIHQCVAMAEPSLLIRNINIFDGVNEALLMNSAVLIEGNLVKAVANNLDVNESATVIDGGGRTLMPGLHDMHTHLALFRQVSDTRNRMNAFKHGAIAAKRAEGMLMNGFTTIMDVGGPAKFVQELIDSGTFVGPRVYSAEALVTQTTGHGDFRNANDPHPNTTGGVRHWFEESHSCLADGPTEVRRCVRNNLRKGATHIKIMAGGGVSSQFDPLHSVQSSPVEIRAAVEAAAGWKTFVSAHALTDESVRMSVENGVKYVIHAAMITDATAKLMAKKGAFMGPTLVPVYGVPEETLKKVLTPLSFNKWRTVADAYPLAMRSTVRHGVKMVFGTDLLAPPDEALELDDSAPKEFLELIKYMTAFEALKTATSNAGELIELTGPNNPYWQGPTGVIREGAYADLLLIDGNPLEDITIMTDPDNNFRIIMKDGVIYKNSL